MQKRARNLAADELLIEVMESRDWIIYSETQTWITGAINIKSSPLLMTFGWGRANRGINFSYVSCFSFWTSLTFRHWSMTWRLDTRKPSFEGGYSSFNSYSKRLINILKRLVMPEMQDLTWVFIYQKKCRPNELLMICEERTGFRRPSPDLIWLRFLVRHQSKNNLKRTSPLVLFGLGSASLSIFILAFRN